MERAERIKGLQIQADLVEDLADAWRRAVDLRDQEIWEAIVTERISERVVAAATGLSRSYINKVRRRGIRPAA